ncbi:acetyl-CoA carboxylase, carboxyltransferase subunit beta [Caproiciproducens galactitolivorans]|uniref:Acetyl-coenzyme A carboxylase carboxyl transferase subunit beta n=1 Tax=Caproiciproducens galactitolivorans TaxID=642589 RepID=A0ABT4BWI5_9FIRM|nr:acetyl-CoA carboxylase, carboxyltransferase subunit beta [Caproiciproducens galactitolivorans]MCY1715259.1 acetyl-CoA carboxylase, carboxyltransferase subunit beta [Caproiciproducens galactitolivorans]
MILRKELFRRPKNELEASNRLYKVPSPDIPGEMCVLCPSCKKTLFTGELNGNANVCPECGYHFRMNARQRINLIADENTFEELNGNLISKNPINFPNYPEKIKHARLESAEKEAVVTGTAQIGGFPCALFVMEARFMMGSMGTVVGEKITRIFEYATERSLPVVGYVVSGGARMQEGILSLMQMAKTSGAVKRHSDAGNLYIAVLTDPTTGGVTASFGMEADIILAEPNALIGFAGPRVIEQTMRQKLPAGFQRAEFLLEKGFVDRISERKGQKQEITTLLSLHKEGSR